MKKITKKILILFSLIALVSIQSCKKDASEVKAKLKGEEIARNPAKFGFKLVGKNSNLDIQGLNTNKFSIYFNQEENLTFIINNTLNQPSETPGVIYEFESGNCIVPDLMSPLQDPIIADDSGTIAPTGLISLDECIWILSIGTVTYNVGTKTWKAADAGTFKIPVDPIIVSMLDYAIERGDPTGWIRKRP